MQGFRPRATAGREEGLPQSPTQRPRRSRRSAYIPAAVPLFPDAPFPAAPKPRCLVVPLPRCPVRLLPPPFSPALRTPKQADLVSQNRKNTPSCPKTSLFGVPRPEKLTSVPQNRPIWAPSRGNTTLPLIKTGIFAHPNPKKTTSRWAKQAFLPNGGRGELPLPFRGNAWVTGDRDSRDSHG